MQRLRRFPFLHALLAALALVVVAPAVSFAQAATRDSIARSDPGALDEARDLIKSGDNDRAIDVLKGVIGRERTRIEQLRDAYLLLIKTYVFLGNDLKLKPQGRVLSDLNYQEARKRIVECLTVKELRHTQPEPASEYPREMVAVFKEVRAQMFGSFTVTEVTPPTAVLLLDSDTLRVPPGKEARGDVDLPVGVHRLVIHAVGYKDLTEDITIPPDGDLERDYRLEKRHGTWWYATRGTAAVGVASLGFAFRGHKKTQTEQPLPAAPLPPTQ